MRFLHFNVKVCSRDKSKPIEHNRSALGSASYRLGMELGRFDYTAKEGILTHKVMLPKGADDSLSDPLTLWSLVDATEKRKDAQLFREYQFDFHNEINIDEQIEALESYIQEHFTSKGMIANYAIHLSKSGNYHTHIMLTMRELNADGKTFGKKNRDWNQFGSKGEHDHLKAMRKDWADKLNVLAEKHKKERVSLDRIENELEKAIIAENFDLGTELKIKLDTANKNISRLDAIYEVDTDTLQHSEGVKIDFKQRFARFPVFISEKVKRERIAHERAVRNKKRLRYKNDKDIYEKFRDFIRNIIVARRVANLANKRKQSSKNTQFDIPIGKIIGYYKNAKQRLQQFGVSSHDNIKPSQATSEANSGYSAFNLDAEIDKYFDQQNRARKHNSGLKYG